MQTTLAESEGKAAPEPLIDRLVNRLGVRAVRRLFPRASHIPELAQSARSALARGALARSALASWDGAPPPKPPRPPLLLTRPEPLTVLAEIPEGPPARFTWRHVTARVVKAEGPERIAPEWWRALAVALALPQQGGGWRCAEGQRRVGVSLHNQPFELTPSPALPLEGEGCKCRHSPRPRDYYRIEDEDGRRYWVFREGLYQESEAAPPGWFLHGVFG